MKICKDEITQMTEEDWNLLQEKGKWIRKETMETEHIVDDRREKVIISLQSDSGSDDIDS